MKDKTLPDKEIVKALECCSSQPQELCCNCPIDIRKIKGGCITALTTYAIDLINRLQAEVEELVKNIDMLKEENGNLTVEFQAMRNAANGFKNELFDKTELLKTATAEIEKLKEIIEYKDICIEACEDIKSEAYKEFAERLKEKKSVYNADDFYWIKYIPERAVDNLLKELVGENDAR